MTENKPTWVFVSGPYRSGSTTQYQIARDIIEETDNGIGIGYHTEAKLEEFDVPGHRYVVCKVFEFLPDGFRGQISYGALLQSEGRILALVSIRDPRDIIVSMRKRAPDGELRFKRTATKDFPIWLGNVEKWVDLGPGKSYYSKFEVFTANLYAEVRRIADYLKIELTDEHAKTIAKRYTIRGQQQRKEKFKHEAKPDQREDPWLPSIPAVIFGTSGHWRTWLSVPEQRMVYEANQGFFERFGYESE